MVRFELRVAMAVAAITVLPAISTAAFVEITTDLTPDNEVVELGQPDPSLSSTAFGTALLLLDNGLNTFDVTISVDGILADDIIGAHLHEGLTGFNGAVIVDLLSGGDTFTQDGSVSGLTLTGVSFPSGNTSDLFQGEIYLNIHTDDFPSGEIRGQLPPSKPGLRGGQNGNQPPPSLPEPATQGLLGLGLAVALLSRRRRYNRQVRAA